MNCDICHRTISEKNLPSEHDPASHVAKAYHRPTKAPDPACWSCRQAWPCETYITYVVRDAPR